MSAESMQPAKQQVLVVDDEPQILTSLEDLLSDEFEILTSSSPEFALNMIDREPGIAVVLSDQRMPKMHGDVLLSHIRMRSDAARLLVTGYADLSAVIRAVNEGQIFAYVTKPWNPESLKHMVHVAADHVRLGRDLSLERKLLTEIIDAVPDAISFTDTEQRFQRVNRAYLEAVGMQTQADLLGQRGRLLVGNSVVSSGLRPFEEERPLEVRGRDEGELLNGSGPQRWYETIQAPVAAPTGARIGQVAISRDITERRLAEQALRESEERLRLMFEGSGAGLFDWNIPDGEVLYSPSRRHDAASLGEGKQGYQQLLERLHPEDRQRWDSMLEDHMRRHLPFSGVELRVRGQDGYRWFELSGQAVWDPKGHPLRLVGSSLDITERKAQEQRISRLTRTHAFLSGVSSVILRASDRAGLMQQSCELAVQVGGLTLAVALAIDGELGCCRAVGWSGKSAPLVAHVERWFTQELQRRDGAVAAALELRQPAVITDFSGGPLDNQELRASPYQAVAVLPVPTDDRIDNVLVLFSEESGFFDQELLLVLSELAGNVGFAFDHLVQSERLALIAYYDELTGLANRSLLTDRLEQQVAVCKEHGGQFALVMLDIGRFRHVNETLGRRLGDRLLVEVGTQLREVIGTKDTLGRVHGDTFVILLANVQDAANVAQWLEHRVLSKLTQPVVLDGTELRLTIKVGIALYPSDASNAEALYQNTEAAHKKAKVGGQDYLFYTPSMNARVAEKLTLETKLRRALRNDEFRLHYQPKVELRSGLVVGGEALIRWHDPEKGLTPPGVFVPILEETGMILDVGRWVLLQAASDYSDWSTRGLGPPRIAVNVSALQLSHPDFVQTLELVLERYPLARHGLELEITESLLMEDLEGSLTKLRSARSMGFTVAIDDFGTGYSSLGYLNRLPIDALKIDRSFVVRMAEDPREMSIVMTIISLAQGLELKVVAEGVETSDQARLLRLLKCDQIQGFLVAKPQPGEEFIKLLGRPHPL